MTKARQVMPMLSVDDLDRALGFYRDLLGGAVSYRFPPEGEPVFLALRLGESEIGIGGIAENPMHGRPQRPAQGHRIELCIYVDDVDRAWRGAAELGCEMLAPPADQPWGERIAFVADPDGNIVMLAAPLDADDR